MSALPSNLAQRAAELRSAFDRSFAAPNQTDAAINQDLLAIRVGAERFAVRLSEVTGIFADRTVTRVPGSSTALVGIAGFRGALLPVYSLGACLGHPATHALRWLVIAAAAPVAFAFDQVERHLRAAAGAIVPRQTQGQMRGHAPELIRAGDAVRPVIHLPSIIDALGTTATAKSTIAKE